MSRIPVPTPSLRTSGVVAGVLAGGGVALCAALPIWCGALVFVGLAVVLAYGWPRLVNLPSPRGTTAVLSVTALVLAVVMLTGSAGHRTRWAGAVVCLGLIGSFLHQLLRQDGRPRLVMSLAGTALGLGFLGAGSYVLAAHDDLQARHLLIGVGAVVVVAAALERTSPVGGSREGRAAMEIVCGAVAGLAGALFGAGIGPALLAGGVSGLLCWSAWRTTVTNATSAHTRAQLAAGSAAALLCCFVPFAVAHVW